jgi:hypothetical protein
MRGLIPSNKLSNAEYQSLPQVGGSSLVKIYFDCPAAYKYGDSEPTKALVDGIAAHVCVLEPSVFAAQYVRGIDKADHPTALMTTDHLKDWCKQNNLSGYSKYGKAELIKFIHDYDPDVQIFDDICAKYAAENEGKTIVAAKDFDMISQMRRVIFEVPAYRDAFKDAEFELSFISETAKVRWDCVTMDGRIIDYKTCVSSHPLKFSRNAHDNGYWLKMALQHDMFSQAYGEYPREVLLLAQSKKAPYIPQGFKLTEEQLRVGRQQYTESYDTYMWCLERNIWPAYTEEVNGRRVSNPFMDLPTPGYLAYQYDMEEMEINEA